MIRGYKDLSNKQRLKGYALTTCTGERKKQSRLDGSPITVKESLYTVGEFLCII